MTESITTCIENKVGYLTFGSERANSLSKNLLKRISECLGEFDSNENVRAVIMRSSGDKSFCSGASLVELASLNSLNELISFFNAFSTLLNTIRNMSKFLILRVQGRVVGGGLGIVSVADYVVACSVAEVRLSELSIGIGPYVVEPAITRRIGKTAFNELSLDAHLFKSVIWAKQKGLYNVVVSSVQELNQVVHDTANRLSTYDAGAVSTLRRLHWKGTEEWPTLLKENAIITAKLALNKPTQDILSKWKKLD